MNNFEILPIISMARMMSGQSNFYCMLIIKLLRNSYPKYKRFRKNSEKKGIR